MNINDLALMKDHIGKMYRIYATIIAFITLIELAFMMRGVHMFNLERLKLRLYLYSYIFLFVSSVAALSALIVFRKREQHWKKLTAMIYIYAFCLVIWSAFVTCIDCYANGDSGIIVYVMTCISVGVLTLIKPIFFASLVSLSGIAMLISIYFARSQQLYSSGFYINFAVFMALAIFINAHNYKLSMREFESGKQLRKLSYTDQLTNVYNRRRLDKHISARTEAHRSFVFMLMDVDNFKEINDIHGHAIGDKCLTALAKKLTERFGERCVYRFGGDEFAVIPQMDEETACRTIEELNSELSEVVDGITIHISAGIYTTHEDDSARNVFIKTDRALYDAKRAGKARWARYNDKNIF